MSIISIDIGSSTTKVIEFTNNEIKNTLIIRDGYTEDKIRDFMKKNEIINLEKVVFTGIGADKVNINAYGVPSTKVEEFTAIANGGLYLAEKEKAIIVSVGTGTAIIEANGKEAKHLGGTGIGAGTLFNICNRMLGVNSFDEILKLSRDGEIGKIDLRIGDITDKDIPTLPKDLTLSNFGKFEPDAKKEDIVLGFVNMVAEVIGMMVAFATIKSDIKEAVCIGNITAIPEFEEAFDKIEGTHKLKFIVPEYSEFAVAVGAIKSIEK